MAERQINYDRGVRKRTHPSGVEVYMYKDQPGVYLNAFGKEVAEGLAKEAGFDTAKLGKARLRREKMAEAAEIIEKELAESDTKVETVEERGGYRLVSIGLGRFHIDTDDGDRLTETPLPRDAADKLFLHFAPKGSSKGSNSDGGKAA